jgi:Sulfotransferase family
VTRLPNFLYIGPDKAGSSWLHEVLMSHPQVFMTPAKDLYYFDRYYDKGTDWYAAHFARAGDEKVVGEVCQDYLFHPAAAERIGETLESPRFMVTLRDPVDRAFSSYLYMLKMGQQPGTFGEALTGRPELLDHGRYGDGLDRFADRFGEDRVHVTTFDDLQADPNGFIARVLEFLDVEPLELSEELLQARLPASKARSAVLARLARAAADWTREHNGAAVVGRVKRAPIVQRMLYQPLRERPTVEDADVVRIRVELDGDLRRVEERFGIDLRRRWGWL